MNEHTTTDTPSAPVPAAATPPTELLPVDPGLGAPATEAGPPAYGHASGTTAPEVPVATQPAAQQEGEEGPRPYVTIVLPCYNEGEHVLREIDRITEAMNASEFTYELLCIDDASTDNTLEVLNDAALRYANIRVMPFRRNGGSGTARRIGTQQAYGEIVVWTDADMTYENERIPELVRILRDDDS